MRFLTQKTKFSTSKNIIFERFRATFICFLFFHKNFKRFEYRLRREVDGNSDDLYLAGGEEVPDEFRDLIDEYFKLLADQQ